MDLRELKARDKEVLKRHPWELARLEVVYSLLKPYLKKENTVLDVGCGDLYVLESLYNKGIEGSFYAADIAFSEEQLKNYQEQFVGRPITVYSSVDNLNKEIKKEATAVLLLDVIEHIEDEISFLKDLTSQGSINNNTLFFITVPAYQSLFTSHDVFLGHYRRYTNKELEKRLNDAGLEIVRKGYFFFSLLFVRILEKIKDNRNPSKTTGLVEWNGSDMITNMVKNILVMDAKLLIFFQKLGVKLPGLSNYAICRKKQ